MSKRIRWTIDDVVTEFWETKKLAGQLIGLKERGRSKRSLPGVNKMVQWLVEAADATGGEVLEKAVVRLFELKLAGRDAKWRLNAVVKAKAGLTLYEIWLCNMVLREVERTGCSQREAIGKIAAGAGVKGESHNAAREKLRRLLNSYNKRPGPNSQDVLVRVLTAACRDIIDAGELCDPDAAWARVEAVLEDPDAVLRYLQARPN